MRIRRSFGIYFYKASQTSQLRFTIDGQSPNLRRVRGMATTNNSAVVAVTLAVLGPTVHSGRVHSVF